ncbi:MAG: hypothetical protein ACPL4N_03050 [Candidatus Norongarragalinales archaeon]
MNENSDYYKKLKPYNRLVLAILEKAVQDLKSPKLEMSLDALLFLTSPLAEDYYSLLKTSDNSLARRIIDLAARNRVRRNGVLQYVEGLTEKQLRHFRRLIIRALPELRRQAIQTTPAELQETEMEWFREGLGIPQYNALERT